ncbi:MAG: hypothetical protein GF390_01840 [Candidatus Pacebacteria bacterium]|nr:hypothetical protein [Candidatus Paceibacterota bacterium]
MKKQNRFVAQFNRLKSNRQLLFTLMFLLVIVVIWTMVSLFTSQKRVGISKELRTLAKPLNPNLNQEVLGKLENKRSFTETELAEFPIYKIISTKDGRNARLVEIGVDEDLLENQLTPTQEPGPSPGLNLAPLSTVSATVAPSPTPTVVP